jgi:hypothetical protein
VLLPQERQRADALHDVVFLPVIGWWRNGLKDTPPLENCSRLASPQPSIVKTVLEHFRQSARLRRRQSRPSVKPSNSSMAK